MAKQLAIFGGSFNPIHFGHLIVAECCLEQARLDRVLFMPAATPPHKQDITLAAPEDRIEMLQLAVGSHAQFEVAPQECNRGGISYTVNTVENLIHQFPNEHFSLILGPDALLSLPLWKDPQRILALIKILAIERHGIDDIEKITQQPQLKELLSEKQSCQIKTDRIRVPAIGIRANQLREAVATGKSIRFRTPRNVELFIARKRLFSTDTQ
ncbi:nicotinate-nucleotide adenylyltransferase [Pirellulales bacterium]|jgi:nicotinate-nucleotide adenylyltransferase|nr:nicotinate-nucleotide adenylyltransferase [Pirellulales bacterium]MDA7937956.1 nicotinate-nucleotide adenylyltransferase [Pirellulales bacterium]